MDNTLGKTVNLNKNEEKNVDTLKTDEKDVEDTQILSIKTKNDAGGTFEKELGDSNSTTITQDTDTLNFITGEDMDKTAVLSQSDIRNTLKNDTSEISIKMENISVITNVDATTESNREEVDASETVTSHDMGIGDRKPVAHVKPNNADVSGDVKAVQEKNFTCSSNNTSKNSASGDVLQSQNSSLCNLLVYNSDESTEVDSSMESDSYESLESSDNEEIEEIETAKTANAKKVQEAARTFGELSLEDLPPVPDMSNLNLNVKEQDCVQMGKVINIVDKLVTVQSLPNIPAYDIDTLLFVDNGKKPFGYVYDVMGQVTSPMYVVRFNNKQDIVDMGIKIDLPIYSAPKTKYTQYVFLNQLMQLKGSDASWMGDNEVPPEHADFSDDEEERVKRRGARKTLTESRKRSSLERHKEFEKDMNAKNLIDTRLHKIRDSIEPSTKRHASNSIERRGFHFQPTCGANYAFTQHGLTSTMVPSFHPSYSPFMQQMPPMHGMPFMTQPIPTILPMQNIPFRQVIPSPQVPVQTVTSQVQSIPPQITPPQIQSVPPILFPNLSVPPPPLPVDMGQKPQQGQSQMVFPPDMGLPRLRSTFVPNMPFHEPTRQPGMWTYHETRPQNFPGPQSFNQPRRGNYFPKRS